MNLPVRRFARSFRHMPDRILHPYRRGRAKRRLAEARPRRLLVLCMGNICRSPYAAGVLERELPGCDIRSAGFLDAGREPPRHAVSVAAERGVNLTGHRSSQVTSSLLDWADLVIVMDRAQANLAETTAPGSAYIERLGDFDPRRIDTRSVIDPIDREREFFRQVYRRIDGCCSLLAEALRSRSTVAGRGHLR